MALQRANIFVFPLDDEGRWFRYHPLFADLLQSRLRQTLAAEWLADLHRRRLEFRVGQRVNLHYFLR